MALRKEHRLVAEPIGGLAGMPRANQSCQLLPGVVPNRRITADAC